MAWTTQQLLNAIAKAPQTECITEAVMCQLTGLTPIQIERSCLKLRKHALLEKCAQGCHKVTEAGRIAMNAGKKLHSGPNCKHTGVKKSLKLTLRVRIWRAIRIRRKFSIAEIATIVAQGGERDIINNIGKYVRALQKAGYLVEMPTREAGTAKTSNGHKRYWLLAEMDTGREAPVWRDFKSAVYDPNTELEHPCK